MIKFGCMGARGLTPLRLGVLRGLIAETTNAAKTSNPISTDIQVLALLKKRISSSKGAIYEFEAAKRDDLKETEEAQIAVLEEYANTVKTMPLDELRQIITEEVGQKKAEGGRVDMGSIMRSLLAQGGRLDGVPVEKAEVAKLVKEVSSQ